MGMALRTVTDDGNFFGFDQINICIAVVINTHLSIPLDVGPR